MLVARTILFFVFSFFLAGICHAELVLDTRFGNAGIVDKAISGNSFQRAPQTTVLPDGRIVVAVIRASRPGVNWDWKPALFLARLLPDGSADPAFGNGAPVMLDLSASFFQRALSNHLVVRPDGSLLALVTMSTGPSGTYHLTHLVSITADGRLDPAFNGGAPLLLSKRGYNRVKVFDTDQGYLVLAGYPVGSRDTEVSQFTALRVRADGTFDPTFGNGGRVDVDAPDEAGTDGMPIPGGGFQMSYFEYGAEHPVNYWRRYRADGSLDTAFGSGGEEAIPAVDGVFLNEIHPLGDGTYAGTDDHACIRRLLDEQGRTLKTFAQPCAVVTHSFAMAQSYGQKILASDGSYLSVVDRDGTIDRAFAEPQGDRWRPTAWTDGEFGAAANGDRGVVLAAVVGSTLRVRRYVDVRGGTPSSQSIPALGLPALLLLLGGMAMFANRRMVRR